MMLHISGTLWDRCFVHVFKLNASCTCKLNAVIEFYLDQNLKRHHLCLKLIPFDAVSVVFYVLFLFSHQSNPNMTLFNHRGVSCLGLCPYRNVCRKAPRRPARALPEFLFLVLFFVAATQAASESSGHRFPPLSRQYFLTNTLVFQRLFSLYRCIIHRSIIFPNFKRNERCASSISITHHNVFSRRKICLFSDWLLQMNISFL